MCSAKRGEKKNVMTAEQKGARQKVRNRQEKRKKLSTRGGLVDKHLWEGFKKAAKRPKGIPLIRKAEMSCASRMNGNRCCESEGGKG